MTEIFWMSSVQKVVLSIKKYEIVDFSFHFQNGTQCLGFCEQMKSRHPLKNSIFLVEHTIY